MLHLEEIYENNFISINTFNAEDNKPFKFAVCVDITEVEDNKYIIVAAASKLPKYLTKKQRDSIAYCMCITVKEVTVNDVFQYGLSANLDSYTVSESEIESTLNEIDSKIPVYGLMCGFYFDRANNRMGKTGWDFMAGKN